MQEFMIFNSHRKGFQNTRFVLAGRRLPAKMHDMRIE